MAQLGLSPLPRRQSVFAFVSITPIARISYGRTMNRTRFERPKLTSAHVIAVLALVVGMAGSATAAAMITGKQIANGTVTTNDIKDKSLLVRDIKPAERAKLKGPSPYAPPPSGKLIKGGGIVSGYANDGQELRGYAPLGFVPADPLSEDDPARTIYFAPSALTEDGDENGTLCQGTPEAPAPTAGLLCVYVANSTNVEANSANVFAGVETTADGADNAGFMVTPDSAADAVVMTFRYVWAYRAP
jgi:hypothetical protein